VKAEAARRERRAQLELNMATALLQGRGMHAPETPVYIAAGYAGLGDFDRALALVDRALSGPVESGLRVFLPEAYRVRGEILLKRDPHDQVLAEQSLLTAIAIAREQSSRTFGLRTALSLARLYQSTGRPAEAHAGLVAALAGFSPTPEMPEIAEAMSLSARLA
jgi:hypothetical protein